MALQPHVPPPPTSSPAGLIVVRVDPYEGHNGNTFFVSGTGFRPNTALSLLIACPSWSDPSTWNNHNWDFRQGPTTDAQGNFSGFPIRKFMIHGVTSTFCVVYTEYLHSADSTFVGDIFERYQVVPNDVPLTARARSIQAHITAHPLRVHAGLSEQISISDGWGGARARLTVSYPHAPSVTVPVTLAWNGTARVRVPISAHATQPGKVSVSASFHLGRYTGRSFTSFEVVR